jgi:hypothetical protein
MGKRPPFTLVYADEVKEHLRAIEAKYHSTIQAEIATQLQHAQTWRLEIGSR